ncbi:type IV pilin protein [Roseateles sp. NT4]|uniref:type IV pilin protein n=1 Tax=Roseateles sp. NT4 TaxID=3453715 RepID=UPI003EEAB9F1
MRNCSRCLHRGFSLIELMVTLVVAGILATLAYPAYTAQMQRGRRADAIAALTAVMQAQERFRSNASAYADNVAALGVNIARIAPAYEITLAGVGPAASFEVGYVATARPLAGGKQARDITCKTLVVTLLGASSSYTATGDPGHSGTDRETTSECWPR